MDDYRVPGSEVQNRSGDSFKEELDDLCETGGDISFPIV